MNLALLASLESTLYSRKLELLRCLYTACTQKNSTYLLDNLQNSLGEYEKIGPKQFALKLSMIAIAGVYPPAQKKAISSGSKTLRMVFQFHGAGDMTATTLQLIQAIEQIRKK